MLAAGISLGACRGVQGDSERGPVPAGRQDSESTLQRPAATTALRVCADPNNLPLSNERGEGLENALAELVGRDMGLPVEYTWWPQRRGFIRNTLQAGQCDVVMGVPADYEVTRTTQPYYTSTYVFVTRRDSRLQIASLDDPKLREVRIGVHVIGDDYGNVPPAQALTRRGIVNNVRGYSIYGDYSKPNPPAALIEAVAEGAVDVAIAWGPLAGYFGSRQRVPLAIRAVEPPRDGLVPFRYAIAMGVRREDEALAQRLDRVIERRRPEIAELLQRFGVPLVDGSDAGVGHRGTVVAAAPPMKQVFSEPNEPQPRDPPDDEPPDTPPTDPPPVPVKDPPPDGAPQGPYVTSRANRAG